MLSQTDLMHLQKCELLIANEIKRICVKNDIKYFMAGGTLLGAVRHGGFIPWDDDMDFGMVRKDYERFCEACKSELDKRFTLQEWDTDTNYPFSFAKVRLNGTHIKELFDTGINKNDGIFVDVFPFDNVSDDEKEKDKQGKDYFFKRRVLWIKKGYGKNIKEQNIKQRIKYDVFSLFCKMISYNSMKKSFEDTIIKFNGEQTKNLVFDAPYSFEKNMIKREWLSDMKEYEFEGESFPSFKDSHSYLEHLYGNYMELPPIEQRHSHDILSVDFGNY